MMLLMAAGGGIVSPPVDLRPVVDDPLVMAMRPAARPLRTITVGPGKEFADLGTAITSGEATQAAAVAAAGLAWPTPNFRIDYLTDPGTHDMTAFGWAVHPFAAFYATGPKGSTTVHPGLEPSSGFYWEGIDVINDQETGFDPKYAFHLHAGWGAIIITRCTLSNPSTTAGGGGTPVGMDGATDATLVNHDVDFTTGAYLNNHGLIGGAGSLPGMSIVYSNCRFPDGSLYFNTLNDEDATEMWVVGGSADTVGLKGDQSILHLDPATVLDRTTGSYAGHLALDGSPAAGLTDSRTDWPVPTGGLSARDRAYYGM